MYCSFVIIIILFITVYILYINLLDALTFIYTHDIKYSSLFSYVYVYNEIFRNGDYDAVLPPNTPLTINDTGKNKYVIFDVGSNIGLYSLYINDKFSNVEIHAFEPIKDLYEKNKHNINQNKKNTNNIIINNLALGEKTSSKIINFYPNADGLSTINNDMENKKSKILEQKCHNSYCKNLCKAFYSNILDKGLSEQKQEVINIIKMSDYIDAHSITTIDLVKIDVEGYELNVLNGINKEHFKMINNLIIEVENYDSNNLNNIKQLLIENNFDVFDLYPNDLWTMIVAKNKNNKYNINKSRS